ncbi:hypothetical protein D3C83_60250 [compost metagenome]
MHRAQHAARPPLAVRERLHRAVGARDAGLEEGVEIEPARHHQPHQVVRDRPEVVERIEPVAEREIEQRLHPQEAPLPDSLKAPEHL